MKRKRIIAGIIAVLLTFLYTKQALGCTIFTSEGKDVVYAASNEDWMYSVGTYMTLTTRGIWVMVVYVFIIAPMYRQE